MRGSERTSRIDPFRVLRADERVRHLDRYARFLTERDGEVDYPNRKLSLREGRMEQLAKTPVAWTGDLDYEGFARAFGGDRSVQLDTATAWLLAAAKASEDESWGVDLELRRYDDRGGFPCDREELMVHVMLQEHYHCLSLAEICRTLGVDFAFSPPSFVTKLLMTVIGALPGKTRWIPVMAAETIGTEVFRVLSARCDVFSATPEVASRLQALAHEIWVDEFLHIAFYRAQLGPVALRVARVIVPVIARAVLRNVPQLADFGCSRSSLVQFLDRGIEVPPEVDWVA